MNFFFSVKGTFGHKLNFTQSGELTIAGTAKLNFYSVSNQGVISFTFFKASKFLIKEKANLHKTCIRLRNM